jgi:hypothetical protein
VRDGWGVYAIAGPYDSPTMRDERRLELLPTGTRVWEVDWPKSPAGNLVVAAYRRARSLVARPPAGASTEPVAYTPDRASLAHRLRVARYLRRWRRWTRDAVRIGTNIGREFRPDLVFSSGPPHDAHEAARRISRTLGVPHIVDLRDPWVLPDSLASFDTGGPYWQRITALQEARVCEEARFVVLNTVPAMKALQARYPALARKFTTVMNGADPELRNLSTEPDSRFLVVHAGALYGGRDPRPLLRGVRLFLDREPAAASHLQLLFIGDETFEGRSVGDIAQSEGVGSLFEYHRQVPRAEALRASQRAAVNVVLQQDWTHSIPSKLFDYMQFPGGILALCRDGDATAQLLEGTAAAVIHPDNADGIATFFSNQFRAWVAGTVSAPINADGRFDRSRQLDRLLEVFNEALQVQRPDDAPVSVRHAVPVNPNER